MNKHAKTILPVLFFLISWMIPAQSVIPPPVTCGFARATSWDSLAAYVRLLDESSDLLETEVIGKSVQGRDLFALKFSSSGFGRDKRKLRVLIFAQQHGNEQSGKEATLLLAIELIKPEYQCLFDHIDLALIPQVNPDGSEVNQRRNANNIDLNRNHIILTEPETMALHRFFDRYLFEVTLDVHEYYPDSESWRKFGYRKNSEVTLGSATNLCVSEKLRTLSDTGYLPYALDYLRQKGYSSFTYCPGGPPGESYIRHSTFDVNDGRQSLAIRNSFSFIQEVMNGADSYLDNLQRRAEGQLAGMKALLEYSCAHSRLIKKMVAGERRLLLHPLAGENVPVQCKHVPDGRILPLPLLSYSTGQDTMMEVSDYRPVVSSILDVTRPAGYLIPVSDTLLVSWAERHDFVRRPWDWKGAYRLERCDIGNIDTVDFEGDPVIDPEVTVQEIEGLPFDIFLFIPTDQLAGNLIILALEPESMLGLATYKQFSYLIQSGKPYPILRVYRKN